MRWLHPSYLPDANARRVTVSSYFLPHDVVAKANAQMLGMADVASCITFKTHKISMEVQPDHRHAYYFNYAIDRGQFIDGVLDSVLCEVYRAGILTVLITVDDGKTDQTKAIQIPDDLVVPCDDPLCDEAAITAFLEENLPS